MCFLWKWLWTNPQLSSLVSFFFCIKSYFESNTLPWYWLWITDSFFLFGPIFIHKSPWMDFVLAWMPKIVTTLSVLSRCRLGDKTPLALTILTGQVLIPNSFADKINRLCFRHCLVCGLLVNIDEGSFYDNRSIDWGLLSFAHNMHYRS